MKTKIFGDKKIAIRQLSLVDIDRAKDFQKFINGLISEPVKIGWKKKFSLL